MIVLRGSYYLQVSLAGAVAATQPDVLGSYYDHYDDGVKRRLGPLLPIRATLNSTTAVRLVDPPPDAQTSRVISFLWLNNRDSSPVEALVQMTDGTTSYELIDEAIAAGKVRNLLAEADAAALGLASGVYTPILTNTTNLAASTAYQCQYLRVGDVVAVAGKADVDPTGAGSCVLGISLPIASAFTTGLECGGVAFAIGVAGQGAGIFADATNDRMTMQWIAVDTANRGMFFTATYLVV